MSKTSRSVLLFLMVLSLSAVLACGNSSPSGPGGKTASATVSIAVQAPSQTQSKTSQKFIGTFDEVTSITVDVIKGGVPLITGQPLTYSGGVWSGTLEDLPIGTALTFIGHAYNDSAVEIFTGTTVQAMTGTNDSVTILMAPVDDGIPAMFPRIVRITVPAQIVTSSTVSIGILVEGSYGDTLVYSLFADPGGGGSFDPAFGSIFLPAEGNTATIVVSYTSPSTPGTFTHSIRVYNNQGNWVETNFATVVAGTSSPSVSVQFAPVITAIGAQRSGSDVTFAAVVSDMTPTTLTYSWGFDGGLTFADAATNPAVLQGYDETKAGNLTLTVTNGAGGTTTVSYAIAPGLLPDNIVVTEGAQWAKTVNAGNNTSKFNSVSAAPDGSVYAAGSINGTGTFDFGNSITSAGTYTGSNILLVKYNRSGVAQWARTVTGGSAASVFSSVAVASDGSVYAAGKMSGTSTYDFGNSVTATGPYAGNNIVLVKYSSSGVAQWARTVTVTPSDSSEYHAVSVASDGSVYAAGYISGTGTYGFGNSVTAAGTYESGNIVLVKYNSSGTAQWARSVTAGSSDSVFYSVSVASDGSVYTAGRIIGTSVYGFGNSVTVTGPYDYVNILLVKYDSSGAAQWARTVTAADEDSSFRSVSVAPDGSVYAAGNLQRCMTFDFGNSVTVTAADCGGPNIVLVKYDSSGVTQWARTLTEGSDLSAFNGVSAASDGSVYAAGYIYGNSPFDFGNSVIVQGQYSNSNIVLVKYSSSGEAQWARTASAASNDSDFSSVFAASDGAVYAAGEIWGAGTFEFGNDVAVEVTYSGYNIILVKYY